MNKWYLAFILICLIICIIDYHEEKDKRVISPEIEKLFTPDKFVAIKKPVLNFGKRAQGRVILKVPPHSETTQVEVRGDDFEVILPKKDTIPVIVYRKPEVRLRIQFGIGMEVPKMKPYARLSFLEIKKVSVFGFWGLKDYGIGVGYNLVGRITVDGLYEFSSKRIKCGIAVTKVFK